MIEEGDRVVTPDADIRTVTEYDRENKRVDFDNGTMQLWGKNIEPDYLKLDDPLRVKVSNERHAEWLVEEAESMGWDKASHEWSNLMKFKPDLKSFHWVSNSFGPDLHWPSDYDQIRAYLEYHASEDEDECETCGGEGTVDWVRSRGMGKQVCWSPCPDCSEDYASYDEPCPEDREWREAYKTVLRQVTAPTEHNDLTFEDLGYEENTHPEFELFDYIDELEQKLESVQEDRDDALYKRDMHGMENSTLRNRIERAKDELSNGELSLDLAQNVYNILNCGTAHISEDSLNREENQ